MTTHTDNRYGLKHEGDYMIKIADVCKLTGLSRSTIYRLISKKEFPAPYKLSQASSVWPKSSIVEFISMKAPRA